MKASAQKTISDAVCIRCACACDDLELSVDDNRIVAAARACELGRSWLLAARPAASSAASIAGRPAGLEEAVEEASRILAAARYPLVYGLCGATCEAQRRAVAIADWTGGNVDTAISAGEAPGGMAFHGVGEVTCTLGEVRHRGDLVIFWGANPHETHPRHAERFSRAEDALFLPGGRGSRTCVVIDVKRTKTTDDADLFINVTPGADFEALWALRALVAGIELDAARVERATGVPCATWQDLAARLKRCRFGVLMYGHGLTARRGGAINVDAALALVRDLNAFTRFVCLPLRAPGNVAGAENLLLWSTGYPRGVNFARGYPRYGPGEFTADAILSRGEADAALIVARDPLDMLSTAARRRLDAIPTICVGADEALPSARVALRTAIPGIEAGGTVYRTDGVPLSLRPAFDGSLPSDADVLERIELRVKQLRGYGAPPARREKPRRV